VIARSSDRFVHHGGGGTALAAMVCGVPQLILPNMPKLIGPARRLAAYGAARTLETGDAPDAQAMLDGAGELLNNPGYRQRAGALAEEIAAMPTPNEVVGLIEKLP
jgi:UDP:flavonoid glycosyltransferase YjiC (YdhE family)